MIAPALTSGGWRLLINGKAIWNRSFVQVWHPTFSPDAKRLAAVVAPTFGRWTIAVDGDTWKTTFGDAVLPPIFSPDGRRCRGSGQGRQPLDNCRGRQSPGVGIST